MTNKQIEKRLRDLLCGFVASEYPSPDQAEQALAADLADICGISHEAAATVISGRVADRWFEDTPDSEWPR